jgi:hypothetical protein
LSISEVERSAGRRASTRNQTGFRYCEVNAVVSKDSIVTQLNTDDSNAGRGIAGMIGAGGSVCAHRLGIKHQS